MKITEDSMTVQALSSRAVVTLSEIETLLRKGYTQSDVAEMYGVTRQYISWIMHTYGGSTLTSPKALVFKHWPFEVPADLAQSSPYKNLRRHGEFVASDLSGKGMSETDLKRLRSFYRKLRSEGLVLEFDPAIPPIPGVSSVGGWAFRRRVPADGDLLIRVNEHTRLTEEGEVIWQFPARDP